MGSARSESSSILFCIMRLEDGGFRSNRISSPISEVLVRCDAFTQQIWTALSLEPLKRRQANNVCVTGAAPIAMELTLPGEHSLLRSNGTPAGEMQGD